MSFLPHLPSATRLLSRRTLLRLGIPLAFGPRAAPGNQKTGTAGPGFGKAKAVLVVFTAGGQSQLETWDPKPNAPLEIRGEFRAIPTTIPGLRLGEYIPRLARLAHRYTILRSMTHDDLDHGSACYQALTGRPHSRKSSNPPPSPRDYPALGAVLQRIRPAVRFPHTAVNVNGPLLAPKEVSPGQFGGFLGRGYDPAELGNVNATDRLLDTLDLPADVSPDRMAGRHGLLARLDRAAASDDHTRQAFDLIASPQVRTALDLDLESNRIRDRYGRYRSGQACLMARRLVEAGVPWVTVFFNHGIRGQDDHPEEIDEYGWDTHNDIFTALREQLLPRFDWSISALLEDMAQRGLLDSTLVAIMGEFGRAPLVALEKSFAGASPGRKHWGACYSVVLAGAGIRAGAVFGASDRHAAYPQAEPTTPADLAATLFHALGIPANAHYTDPNNRPYRVTDGNPVTKLFAG